MIQKKKPSLNKPLSTNTSSVRLQPLHSTFQHAQSSDQAKKLSSDTLSKSCLKHDSYKSQPIIKQTEIALAIK